MPAKIYPARRTQVTVAGETIEGLQSIEFRIVRKHTSIEQVGTDERIGVEYGLKQVEGKLKVISTTSKLDELLYKTPEEGSFQIVITMTGKDGQQRTVTLDECYIQEKSFEMNANGLLVSVYSFTATRIREPETPQGGGGG